MDFNSTNQRGHLARDPQITQNEKGIIARFTLAVNRPKKANGESAGADFISCVCYSPEADKLLNVKKGAHVALTGPIVTGSYEKEGVGKVYTTDVRADILFVYPEVPAQSQTPQAPQTQPQAPAQQPQQNNPVDNFVNIGSGLPWA